MRDRSAKPDGDATSKALAQWFAEKRGAKVRVSVATLKRQAKVLNDEDLPRWWFSKWKQRYNIFNRAVQRCTTKTLAELMTLLQSFHSFVYGAKLNNVVGVYVNFDEITFSYSGQMSGGHTVDYRGANNVMTSEDPAWDKRCCSFIPCLCIVKRALSGYETFKLPCCLLLRRSAKSKWVLSNPMNWLISETGSGVVNFYLMMIIKFSGVTLGTC